MSMPIQCATCRHYLALRDPPMRCTAFPEGIPAEIATGHFDHSEAHPNDKGIRYESVTTHAPTD
jgi:hypothetical protein